MRQRHLWNSTARRRRGSWTWVILGPAIAAALLGALATAADERSPQRGADVTPPQTGADEGSPRRGADEAIWQTIFRGATEVNVVGVDVVVTDRDGRPVTGLTRADFELFDGKQSREISNFYAVEGGEPVPLTSTGDAAAAGAGMEAAAPDDVPDQAPVEKQPAHLILYVDSVNLAEINRARVFARLREFLLAQRRFGPRVMLVSNDRSLVIRQGFTSVPHETFVALEELEKTAAPSPRFDLERRNLLRAIERVDVEGGSGLFATKDRAGQDVTTGGKGISKQGDLTRNAVHDAERAFFEIQNYSRQRLQHTRDSLRILRQLVATAAGLPGRKSVVHVSDGLALRPGEAMYEAYSRRFEALADTGARVHVQSEAARDDATGDFQTLLEEANAGKVTFYTLDAAPADRLSYGGADSEVSSGGNFAAWNDSMASTETYNRQQGLRLLAQGTGGRFGPVHTAWDVVLEGVVSDFDNYYSLGFVADNVTPEGGKRDTAEKRGVTPEGGKRNQRRLEVKVRGQDLVVRHRSSFRDKPVTDRTAERTRAALLIDEVANPFEVVLATEAPQPQDDGTYLVPLAVRIPLGKLVLVPGKTEHQGRVSMFVAVRDDKGRTSEVNRHLCPIRIPNADVLTALGQSASCGLRLVMRRGPQRIAVSVLDELTSLDSTVHLALDVGSAEQTAELASSR